MPESNDMLYWAPSRILRRGDRYLLFPTLNKKIRVAAADSPEGPFHLIADSRERPLLDTIDAEVFVDDDGQGYLFSNHRRAWRMNEDLTGVVGEPITIPTNAEVTAKVRSSSNVRESTTTCTRSAATRPITTPTA